MSKEQMLKTAKIVCSKLSSGKLIYLKKELEQKEVSKNGNSYKV